MKIPSRTIHLVIGLEAFILVAVLIFSILNPIKNAMVDKVDFINKNEQEVVPTTEEVIDTQESVLEYPAIQYTEAVENKVASMSVEQKVAQMFVTTPEQLTNMRQVTVTGNTSKTAISEIPVGGLIYTAHNFEGSIQTASMTENLQEYYIGQFGFPVFLMVSEVGGQEGSPLATSNGFSVEKTPEEIGALNDVDTASGIATNIANYMNNQGLNTNIGISGTYSADEAINIAMLDTTISAYKSAGIFTATTGYHGDSDIIILGNAEPFSETVHSIRYDMQYQGILFANTCVDAQGIIDVILAGADMVYCENDFKATYQTIVDSVNNGTIGMDIIDEAVKRILTYKNYE